MKIMSVQIKLVGIKNQTLVKNNKFNFNGISFENSKSPRIRVRWSSGEVEYKYNGYRAKQYSKSFNLKKYNYDYNKILRDAILFRIDKMKKMIIYLMNVQRLQKEYCLKMRIQIWKKF